MKTKIKMRFLLLAAIAGMSILFTRCNQGGKYPDHSVPESVATKITMDKAQEYFDNYARDPYLIFGGEVPSPVSINLTDSLKAKIIYHYFGKYPNGQICIVSFGYGDNGSAVAYSSPPMNENTEGQRETGESSPVCPPSCKLRPPCPPYCPNDTARMMMLEKTDKPCPPYCPVGILRPPCPPYCPADSGQRKPPCPPYCDTTGNSKYVMINRPPCPPYCDTIKWVKIQKQINSLLDDYMKQPVKK